MAGGEIESVIGAGESALVADAAAQELTAASHGKRRLGDPCANCGAKLAGPHCHMCGQVADDLHRPFWSLFMDALEGLFALDGRFLRTVPALLFRPGLVTKTYLDGARARYVPPFRLYLVAAVVFLLAVSIVTGDWTDIDFDDPARVEQGLAQAERELAEAAGEAEAAGAPAAEGLARARDEIAAARDAAIEAPGPPDELRRLAERQEWKCEVRRELLPEELGSCPAEADGDDPDVDVVVDAPFLGPGVNVDPETGEVDFGMDDMLDWPIGVRRFIVQQAETIIDDPSRFLEAVNRWISRVLISLFPVYALLLALMHFWKRRFYYYDHLVVSLHFHAFLFILLTLLIAAGVIIPVWALCIVFLIWSNLYLYKAHRLVYRCGRFTSVLRVLVLDFVYLIILSFAPLLLAITGFLTA